MNNLFEEKRELVLARFRILNPNSRIQLNKYFYTVNDLIKEIKEKTSFGNEIVKVQIKMLQMFSKD